MEKIRIALPNRVAGSAPVFATVEGGYFQQNGLDPVLIDYAGHSLSIPAVIAGEADFTNAVSPELITANLASNGDAVIIAAAICRSAQQISARPGLRTREDLRGKRWAIQARGDADEISIAMTLERWGWNPEKDIQLAVVGRERPRLESLLDEQKADVAIMHAPETFLAEKKGWRVVEDLARLGVAFQNSNAATTRRLLKARPETALRYVRAYCQGVYRFRTDSRFGVSVLQKYCMLTDREIAEKTWVMYARFFDAMNFPSLEGVRNAIQLLHRVGRIDRIVPPEDFVDMSFVARLEEEGFFGKMMGLGAS